MITWILLFASISILIIVAFFLLNISFWLRLPLAALATVLALLSSGYIIANSFTGEGINESVLYHLMFGLEGAGFKEYSGIIFISIVLILISLIYGWCVFLSSCRHPAINNRFSIFVVLPLIITAWGINPAMRDLATVGYQYVLATPQGKLPNFFVEPKELNLREGIERPRNLVLIYAESLERNYFDKKVFDNLLPRLSARESKALSFTGIKQLPGMWWTMGGKVGSQCGMPLVTVTGISDTSNTEQYLPGARCLGDLLGEKGYQLHYMGGANSTFAGKKDFYLTHGFDVINGLSTLKNRVKDPEVRNNWGLYDDDTLSLVAKRFDKLASKKAPFVLATLTLGTHHPKGHLSPSCDGPDYNKPNDPMIRSVKCSDMLINKLVKHVQESPHADDTLVVLMSDHIAMKNTLSKTLEAHPRRNLFMAWGKDIPQEKKDRSGSQLDMGPTLLTLMGYKIEALGLGRNLLGDQENFVEAHDNPDISLRETFPSLRKLWGVTSLDDGLLVKAQSKEVVIEEKSFDFPLMLKIDEENRVEAILGGIEDLNNLPDRSKFVWVDICRKNSLIIDGGDDACVLWGDKESNLVNRLVVESGTKEISSDMFFGSKNSTKFESSLELGELLSLLKKGGKVIVEGQTQSNLSALANYSEKTVMLEAEPNVGMGFVRWRGLEGKRQFSNKVRIPRQKLDKIEPIFDKAVAAPNMEIDYRSAWVGAAYHASGRLVERLSPGDSRDSIARVAFWQPSIGSIDLRGFGGFKSSDSTGFIQVNGKIVSDDRRGLQLVVLSSEGEVKRVEVFDTHASKSESNALAKRLSSSDPDDLLLLASFDEFTSSLTPRLNKELMALGFQLHLKKDFTQKR